MSILNFQVMGLRQYTLHRDMHETLIELFERELIEPQAAVGCHVLGPFRDLGDPGRFVWFRGLRDMPARAEALGAFYGGATWRTHRNAANATMIDSDNVPLLRPARPGSGLRLTDTDTHRAEQSGALCTMICSLQAPVDEAFLTPFEREIATFLAADGTPVFGSFVIEPAENNFPALPVRAGESLSLRVCPDTAAPLASPAPPRRGCLSRPRPARG